MIGSSPDLGPILAGISLLKWRKVKYRFLNTGFCPWPFESFCRVCLFFPESIDEGTGKGRSYVKNLNMNGEFIDVVGNMV